MLRYSWTTVDIKTEQDWESAYKRMIYLPLKELFIDTETSGLHIINDKPFLFQFGFVDRRHKQGYSYTIDIPAKNRYLFNTVLSDILQWTADKEIRWVGHNLKYDLHMLCNIGWRFDKIKARPGQFTDTQFYIRHAHDTLHIEEGGPPMKLKEYAAKYIDHTAKYFEKELRAERSQIAKEYNLQLRKALNLRVQDLGKYFSDPLYEVSDLPDNLRNIYIEWKHNLPIYLQNRVHTLVEPEMISYATLNRETLIRYAHKDIIYTAEIFYSLQDPIEARDQLDAVRMEEDLILPLLRMERTGFDVDKEYLETARVNLKNYILKRRQDLLDITIEPVNIGQHQRIKEILHDQFDLDVASTGEEQLNLLKMELPQEHPAIEFINILQDLRTLTKWYSAYIVRFQKNLKTCDRLYTTINQVGAVSGRVTSDFQQFPKKAIYNKDGVEIFHPRKIVKTDYAIAYLDYSQIELRIQAEYTVLLGAPDLNLCRAYFPYKCVERNGQYYLEESPEILWHPTDIHGATTTAATGLVKGDKEFEKLRSDIGKRVNFAKNYGAQLGRFRRMFPEKSEEECKRIDASYYTAFPGLKIYHEYCARRASQFSNTKSLFGVRFYNASGHKLKNLLIQGSAAHLLKLKIFEIDQYLFDKSEHIRMQMQIHDELSFEIYDEQGLTYIPEIKRIMENWPACSVPIIAEYELTRTCWAGKEKVK